MRRLSCKRTVLTVSCDRLLLLLLDKTCWPLLLGFLQFQFQRLQLGRFLLESMVDNPHRVCLFLRGYRYTDDDATNVDVSLSADANSTTNHDLARR